ncbi:hypothetical protein NPS53_09345 [Pseudomonas putida]|uniref:hypothetical protein n=1 Tax=Pseudomonas putida TaxID=303 RepID=UPI002363F7AD|nr:hypothetical protein [Pseudomonas putida]MDD2139781.1 hypothetical protein [Pseudomonas putida]HDS1721705.1 hypothetical protein [Pseudomonas putida]
MNTTETCITTQDPAQAKYVVLNEHTLCYRIEATPTMLGVLAGSVRKGGHNPLYGPVSFTPRCTLREATQKDFDEYRVCSKGYQLAS